MVMNKPLPPIPEQMTPSQTVASSLHGLIDDPIYQQNNKWAYRFKRRVKDALRSAFAPIMKSPDKAPLAGAKWYLHLYWNLLLPPSGVVGRTVTVVLIALMVWAAMWSVLKNDMLPYGNMFGLYIMVVFALLAGFLVEQARLAPLLGMLIIGCILRNVIPINYAKYIDGTWSSSLRNIALSVILTRAGLGLDINAIKQRFWVVVSLCSVPTVSITIFILIVAHYMIDFPWLMSGALGFLISAVSPAVIVPIMLYFQEQRIGTVKGLPSLIIAAATICDVIAICGNSICLGIALSSGSLTFNIIAAPLSIVVGIGFGLFAGVCLWYFPSGDDDSATIFRFILLCCGGVFCIFASKVANISGAGALGALTIPLTAAYGWRKRGWGNSVTAISVALKYAWYIFQPLLFGLIGASVDFATLIPERVGLMIGLLFAAHAVQLLATWLAVGFFGFSWKETLFLCLSFLPKATIQAAIGSTALDIATKNHMGKEFIDLGRDTLNCAVLAIIFFAPIGGVALLLSGGKLLDHEDMQARTMEEGNPINEPMNQLGDDKDVDLSFNGEAFELSPRRRLSFKRYSLPY